jgi:hypothetical protein
MTKILKKFIKLFGDLKNHIYLCRANVLIMKEILLYIIKKVCREALIMPLQNPLYFAQISPSTATSPSKPSEGGGSDPLKTHEMRALWHWQINEYPFCKKPSFISFCREGNRIIVHKKTRSNGFFNNFKK